MDVLLSEAHPLLLQNIHHCAVAIAKDGREFGGGAWEGTPTGAVNLFLLLS